MDPYTEFAIAKKDERIDNLEARLKDAEEILAICADGANWCCGEFYYRPDPKDMAQSYFKKWGK